MYSTCISTVCCQFLYTVRPPHYYYSNTRIANKIGVKIKKGILFP